MVDEFPLTRKNKKRRNIGRNIKDQGKLSILSPIHKRFSMKDVDYTKNTLLLYSKSMNIHDGFIHY